MASFDERIAISHLRQFLFCPRIPWFKQVMCFEPPEQGWVSQGKRWHQAQSPRHRRRVSRYLDGEVIHQTDVYVFSEVLGIHGYVDELISNGEQAVVIEYKVDKQKPSLAQKLQLIAYSVCVEESLNLEVVAAVLLKGEATKQYKVEVSTDSKAVLLQTLSKLQRVLASHRMPESSASEPQCNQCEYLRYCNDR